MSKLLPRNLTVYPSEETNKEKTIRILKSIGTLIYVYTPAVIIGILGLYIFIQLFMFVSNIFFNWEWTQFVAKNSPFKCFAHATNFWLGLAKPILFYIICKIFVKCVSGVKDYYTDLHEEDYPIYKCGTVCYLIALIPIGVLYCMLNNTIFHYLEILAVPLLILWVVFLQYLFMPSTSTKSYGGGGGGDSSSSSCRDGISSSQSYSNWEKEQHEKWDREREQNKIEQERKHNTIRYAKPSGSNNVRVEREDGTHFNLFGKLMNCTSSTVTVYNRRMYETYNASGKIINSTPEWFGK